MPRSTNPFVSRLYFWLLIAPILSALVFPALLSIQQLQIAQDEADLAESAHRDVVVVNETAASCFNSWFVGTGILKATMADSERAESKGWAGYSWMGTMTHTWFIKFWLFVYRWLWRWIAFWPIYVAGIVGIAVPCLVDGAVIRSKKRFDFGQYNPLAFGMSGRLVAFAIGLLFYVPMYPFTLTGALLVALFSCFGLFSWLTAANFQRGR